MLQEEVDSDMRPKSAAMLALLKLFGLPGDATGLGDAGQMNSVTSSAILNMSALPRIARGGNQ